MKNPFELEIALGAAASEYSYENSDKDFSCLAEIKVANGQAVASITNGLTLTPEEVEFIRVNLTRRREVLGENCIDNLSLDEMDEWFLINDILVKIEQWQDGRN